MTRSANEKLAWEGEGQSENNIFFTQPESPTKVYSDGSGSGSGSVVFSNPIHLMYNGAEHATIVEQLTVHKTLEFFTNSCT
jgi:hypothetical protein